MRYELLELLRCPVSGQRLKLVDHHESQGEIASGVLATHDSAHRYPIRGFIPGFVPADNYAASFGMRWNRSRLTHEIVKQKVNHAICYHDRGQEANIMQSMRGSLGTREGGKRSYVDDRARFFVAIREAINTVENVALS